MQLLTPSSGRQESEESDPRTGFYLTTRVSGIVDVAVPDVAVTVPAGTPPEKDLVLDRALAFLARATGTTPALPLPSGSPTAFVPDAALVSWDDGALRLAFV